LKDKTKVALEALANSRRHKDVAVKVNSNSITDYRGHGIGAPPDLNNVKSVFA
jgi:hypothetical protein